jgi:uracil-DNA glycosylase family 4
MNKHPLADCDHCPLKDGAYVPTKYPTGGRQARYVVVGEAPGFQEKIWGEPFRGPSGQLIKEVLKRHGIDEDECIFTNVVLCYEKDNPDPSKDAISACRARLNEDLSQPGIQRALLLGNFAAKSVLSTKDGILKLRVGPPRHTENHNGLVVVPTVHPAACLRTSDYFPFLVTDVGKLVKESQQWTPPKYKVADTEAKALAYLRFLEAKGSIPLTVDIETAVEKDVAYEHPQDTDILCVGIAYDPSHAIIFTGDSLRGAHLRSRMGTLLSRVKLAAQNGKFDVPVLRVFDERIRLGFDTMLASYAIDPRRGIHGLKAMAAEHLGAPDYAASIKQYTRGGRSFGNIPPEVLHEYNAYDCALTYQLYEMFSKRLEAEGTRSLHDFLVRAANALMEVEHDGVSIDLDHLDELDTRYQAELATLEERLQQWVANPRSPAQVKSALYQLGVTTASTDVRHLQDIRKGMERYGDHSQAKEVSRFVDAQLEYRSVHKLWSTYIQGLIKRHHNGKVHTSYLLHVTSTGRLSSRNPNLQNIPIRSEAGRELRQVFVPTDPNSVFVQADYAQGETRIVACLSGDEYLLKRFREGRDVIADVQAELFPGDTSKATRVRVKNIMYGSWYGMVLGSGDEGRHYAKFIFPDLSPIEAYERANAYQRRLFGLVRGIPTWQEATREKVLGGDYLETFMRRKRRFWLISSVNKTEILNECLAFVPQSTLSDLCLLGLCELVEQGYKVRLTVHDSVVVECHESEMEATSDAIGKILSGTAERFTSTLPPERRIPFPVETSVGRTWADC